MANLFVFNFKSELKNVNTCLKELMEYIFLIYPNISEEDNFDLRLIFSELLYNAVIHGNKMEKNKNVKLMVEFLENHTIKSTIEDEGEGFDHKSFYENINKPNYSDRGRGIQLAMGLCDSLEYGENGRQTIFLKRMNFKLCSI